MKPFKFESKVYKKEQILKKIEEIKQLLGPNADLFDFEEGVKYNLWIIYTGPLHQLDSYAEEYRKIFKADKYYNDFVIGKYTTVWMLMPEFN